jgi:hypothetical protein
MGGIGRVLGGETQQLRTTPEEQRTPPFPNEAGLGASGVICVLRSNATNFRKHRLSLF